MGNDLMKPRYKVIADYPDCPWDVETILMQDPERFNVFVRVLDIGGKYDRGWVSEKDIAKFSHLFKLLAWYEERPVEDFPKYLKAEDSQFVIKVRRYTNYKLSGWAVTDKDDGNEHFLSDFLPATETEYHQYINKKQ